MMELQHYIDAFSSLHTANKNGYKAPHKAVLLLAIIDLVEDGNIVSPYIKLTDELNDKFKKVWHRYIGTSAVFTPDVCKPYFHMQYESFWRLVDRDEVDHDKASEPNLWVMAKKQRKELPVGRYSIESMRRAFAYAEIDGMLLHVLQNSDARAMLRVTLITTYFAKQPTVTMPDVNSQNGKLTILPDFIK